MNQRTTRRHGGMQKTETTVAQCLEKREIKIGTNKSMKTAPSAVFGLPNDSCVLAALKASYARRGPKKGCGRELCSEPTRAVARKSGCTPGLAIKTTRVRLQKLARLSVANAGPCRLTLRRSRLQLWSLDWTSIQGQQRKTPLAGISCCRLLLS